MLKVTRVDMDAKFFAPKYHLILTKSKEIDPKLTPKQYTAEVYKIVRDAFGSTFIILLSHNLYYNIQTKLKTTAIMILGSIKIIVYQARPFAYPQLNKFEHYTDDDKRKYLDEAPVHNVEEFRVVKNNLIEEQDLKDITEYMKIYLNKNKDVKDYQAEFLKSLKIYFLSKTGSLFLHLVLAESKTFSYQIPEEIDFTKENKELKIEMKLGTDKKNYTFIAFEKQGQQDDYLHRIIKKWKEFFIFLFMFFIVILLSVCRENNGKYLGYNVDGVCRNKTTFLFLLGAGVVGFVMSKSLNKKGEKMKARRKQN